jgi:hypothetical protein
MRPRFVIAGVLFVSSACSSGGGDLNALVEKPKPLGQPIADQVAPDRRLPDGQTLSAQGVVVIAIDGYDETKNGRSIGDIYVQDPVQNGPKGTPWSGLKLYRPAKNPPEMDLVPGQGVNLSGEFVAITGVTSAATGTFSPFNEGLVLVELVTPSVTLAFEGRPPEPIELTYGDVLDPYIAQQYQNRLVRFRNVTLTSDFTGVRFEATTDGPFKMASKFFPVHETTSLSPTSGTTYKSVTGVFDFFFDYKLCPRSVDDIEL